MAGKDARAVWLGNPVSLDHRPDLLEVADWGADLEDQLSIAVDVTDRVAVLEGETAFASLLYESWAELQAQSGAGEGQRAEVDAGDTGTHGAATATGYDGASVANSGAYRWDSAWSRWVRVGDIGAAALAAALAAKADQADLATVQNAVAVGGTLSPGTVNFYDSGGTYRGRLRVSVTGETIFEVAVDGQNVPVFRVNVTPGSALAGRVKFDQAPITGESVSRAVEFFTPRNLQRALPEGVGFYAHALQASQTMAKTKPDDFAPVVLGSSVPYLLTAGDLDRLVYVTAAGADLDAQFMGVGQKQSVLIEAGASLSLYAGEGRVWTSASETTLQVSGPAVLDVWRLTATRFQCVTDATVTASSAAPAARAYTVTGLGQSLQAQLFKESGLRGMQEAGFVNFWPIDCARGSTSIHEHWDVDLGVPKQVALDAAAEYAARPSSQPAAALTLFKQGLGDVTGDFGLADSGDYTPGRYKLALQQYLDWWCDHVIGDPDHKILILPLGSADNNITPGAYYAIRRVQAEIAAENANVSLGPESFDLPRDWNDPHLTLAGNIEFGRRVAAHIQNILDGAQNLTGPTIAAHVDTGAGGVHHVDIDIDQDDDGSDDYILLRPGATKDNSTPPVGFALLPSLDVAAVPYEIESVAWSKNGNFHRATITTVGDSAGAILAYPWGSMIEARTGAYIRGMSTGLPLRLRGA